jgi:hypothetical protein
MVCRKASYLFFSFYLKSTISCSLFLSIFLMQYISRTISVTSWSLEYWVR